MTQIWHTSYFLSTLFTFSDPHHVIKSQLMSWRVESGVLDEGDSAALLQDSFENHFRDMFINTCMHSFKAALIAFLETSRLNWPPHCMHIVYFALWYEIIQASTRRHLCVCNWARVPTEHSTVSALVWLAPAAEVKLKQGSEMSPVWCGRKDVLLLNKCTPCQEKKWQKQQLWVGWPTLAPPQR